MRTTVNLDPDVQAAVAALRADRSLGLSEAINELARRGAALTSRPSSVFSQPTVDLGLRFDVSNVSEALDVLEASE